MSANDRQSRLLVAEDWKRIYQSFRNADFQSYDFDNLRRTMINYLRQNYPEDFNDYIESSEYLALIDMIAFLGQNLSFRIDLNARENSPDKNCSASSSRCFCHKDNKLSQSLMSG